MKNYILAVLMAFGCLFANAQQTANTFIECKPCSIDQTKCLECDGNQILAELFDGMVVTTAGIPTKLYRPFYTTYDARVVTVRDIFGNQAIIHLNNTAYNSIASLVQAISDCKCHAGLGGGGIAAMLVNDKLNGLDIVVNGGGDVEVDFNFNELAQLLAPDGTADRIPVLDVSTGTYTFITPNQINPENFDTITQANISLLPKDPICDCWLLTENAGNTGWELASADNIDNALVFIGIEAIDNDNMKVGTRFDISGLAGSAIRQDYYLSDIAGTLQTTPATIKSHVMFSGSRKRHFDVQEHLNDPSNVGQGVLEIGTSDADGDTKMYSTEGAQDVMFFQVDGFTAGQVEMLNPLTPKWTLNGIVDPISFVWTPTDTTVLDGYGATGGWSAFQNNVLYIHDGTNWRSVWDGTSVTYNDTTVYTPIATGTKVEQHQNGAIIKTDTIKDKHVFDSDCYELPSSVPYDLNVLGDPVTTAIEASGAWLYTPSQNVTISSISQNQSSRLFGGGVVTRKLILKTGGINGTAVVSSDLLTYNNTVTGIKTYIFPTPVELVAGTVYSVVTADAANTTVTNALGDAVFRTTAPSDVNNEILENGAGTPDKLHVRVQGTVSGGGGDEILVNKFVAPNGLIDSVAINKTTGAIIDITGGIPATWSACQGTNAYASQKFDGAGTYTTTFTPNETGTYITQFQATGSISIAGNFTSVLFIGTTAGGSDAYNGGAIRSSKGSTTPNEPVTGLMVYDRVTLTAGTTYFITAADGGSATTEYSSTKITFEK